MKVIEAKLSRGFSMIEMLVVMAILTILALLVIPNMVYAIHKSRQSNTMARLHQIGVALEMYSLENNCLPNSGLASLKEGLKSVHQGNLDLTDEWGNEFIYEAGPAGKPQQYTVFSKGKDDVQDPSWAGGASHDFKSDIVLSQGVFFQFPEGQQD